MQHAHLGLKDETIYLACNHLMENRYHCWRLSQLNSRVHAVHTYSMARCALQAQMAPSSWTAKMCDMQEPAMVTQGFYLGPLTCCNNVLHPTADVASTCTCI